MFNERRRKEHSEIVQEAGDFAEFQGAFLGFGDTEEATVSQQRHAGVAWCLSLRVRRRASGACGDEQEEG